MGARGPRAILKRSEYVEKGAKISFTLKVLKPLKPERNVGKAYQAFIQHLKDLFDAGETIGLLKDRVLGFGKFKAAVQKEG